MHIMRKKKVMVLAGSKWQVPIIKKLKEAGCEVWNVNPFENSPGFAFSDGFGLLDVRDKQACLEFAKQHNIDAVLSEECDIAVPTVAYVADELKLPSIGADMAELYTNKYAMREFCKNNGLLYPKYRKCKSVDEAKAFLREINGKIIIKPLDANSSRGVFTIENEAELEKHFAEALEYSKFEKCVIAERYINGTEFTVDGIKTPDKHYTMAVSEKKHYKSNENVASELYFSHSNRNFDYEKLRQTNDRFVNLSGLPFGLTHAEYKYENGEYYLIEIAARGGGNLISAEIVPIMTGIDNYSYFMDCCINGAKRQNFDIPEEFQPRCAVLKFLDVPGKGGVVKEIDGIDFLQNCPNITTWDLSFKTGDTIKPAKDDSARIGFYIAYANSREELDNIMKQVENKLNIVVG